MQKKEVENCCGNGSKNITGCRISISPMSDNFVEIILGSIEKTDTSNVWSFTDSLGTLFRGQQKNVVSATKELFLNAYDKNIHMVASLKFSRGCPGDTEADYLESIYEIASIKDHDFDSINCEANISFYTFGNSDYMNHIYKVINIFKEMGIYSDKSHYSTILKGSIKQIFEAYDRALSYGNKYLKHYVIETNISVNSPSKKKGE